MSKKQRRRHNRPWTPHDVKRMRKYASDGLSSRVAAERLGRSRGAVAYKAMTLKVEFHAINQPYGVQQRIHRRVGKRFARLVAKRDRARTDAAKWRKRAELARCA